MRTIIWQLKLNPYHGRDLQSWNKIKVYWSMPQELKSDIVGYNNVQRELEKRYCSQSCLHKFKIICFGSIKNPDIFDTRILEDQGVL